MKLHGSENEGCFLFSSLQSAQECVDYSTSPRRDDGVDRKPVPLNQLTIRAFSAKDRFWAVFYPLNKRPVVAGFWVTPGAGISSRFAEANLGYLDQLQEMALTKNETFRSNFEGPIHQLLQEKIAHHLERAPLNPNTRPSPATNDIYFFPTGMAAIYKPHLYLLKLHQGSTVLFGMAFLNTTALFEEVGTNYKFFGHGTDEDLHELETFLRSERDHGRKVQAIWAEFPANPLLVTPDVTRLRELADEYDTILALDDTIGSWANIDVTAISDLLVTSITKSFNGYADVIAGCVILNPASRKYHELKKLFDEYYVPELYVGDAEAIERNSRDYLSRTAKLNHNAISLAKYLQTCADDPKSAVRAVHYPSINPSGVNYKRFMRPATAEFTPGYGCLLSIELEDLPTTIAFYDNLNVHIGPHLGAPFTLACAYTMIAYGKKLDWAAQYGLKPTQIRISAGLEDTPTLLEDFRIAVEAADNVKMAKE